MLRLLPVYEMAGRAARLLAAFAAADDKCDWVADKLAWRRFWQRLPQEHQRNIEFDERYGVVTADEVSLAATGVSPERAAEGNGVYRPLWESEFHAALARLKIPFERFTFVDMGSGKGKLLLLAANYPFVRIVGVEYSPRLHEIAGENVRRYRSDLQRCHCVQTVLADAAVYPLPAGPVVAFIFNSFDAPTMRRVLLKLDQEAKRPNPLYVIYVNVRRIGEIRGAADRLERLRPIHRSRTLLILQNSRP